MIRRQLLRQSRAISESLTKSSQLYRSSVSSFPSSSISPRYTALSNALPPYSNLGRRWQSTGTAEVKAEEQTPEPQKEDPSKLELEQKNKEIIDLKDKYLRSVADYRNLQDRTRRDMESARQFAIQRFATDLLDSIDNLDRALSSVPESALTSTTSSNSSSSDPNTAATSESTQTEPSSPNKDLQNLHSGLRMTEGILMSTLKKHGLERFDPLEEEQGKGRKFDPNTDEAMFYSKVDGKQDGDVFFTQSKGFKLNGRIVRAAKVGVVKNS